MLVAEQYLNSKLPLSSPSCQCTSEARHHHLCLPSSCYLKNTHLDIQKTKSQMYYSRVLLQTPLFMVSKIMYLHSLPLPAAGLINPPPAVHLYLRVTHYLWCLHGTSPPSSLPLYHVRPISFQETENQTLSESREVHFLGLGPLSLLLPQCSELKTSFPFEGSISHCQLREACPAFCHSIRGSRRQTIHCAEASVLLQGRCFPSKVPVSLLNFPHLSWTVISWSYVHQTSSQSGLMWQIGRSKPKLSSLPGNQLQG